MTKIKFNRNMIPVFTFNVFQKLCPILDAIRTKVEKHQQERKHETHISEKTRKLEHRRPTRIKPKETKITKETKQIIVLRCNLDINSEEYKIVNKTIKREIRKDGRSFNTRTINAVENNKNKTSSNDQQRIHRIKNGRKTDHKYPKRDNEILYKIVRV